jgi:hypothetical protein
MPGDPRGAPPCNWVCERELREGQGGRPLHLPDGVVLSADANGRRWRTAVEVELTRKTEARVAGILRHLLRAYDDVVYRAVPDAGAVVTRAAAAIDGGDPGPRPAVPAGGVGDHRIRRGRGSPSPRAPPRTRSSPGILSRCGK